MMANNNRYGPSHSRREIDAPGPTPLPLAHVGGSKGLEFAFALLSLDGQVIGRVEGIDRHDDSPFVEHHYRLAIDRAHGRIVYKNKTSFFLFDFQGGLLAWVKLEAQPLKSLSAWKLGCCSPDGRIVLSHPEQHLLLVVDPVTDPDGLESALRSQLFT